MHWSHENGQNHRFWLFGSFKKVLLRFLIDPLWLIQWPNRADHLVLLYYAISSQSDTPKSRKQPETSFLAIWIIHKGIFLIFECSIMTDTMAKWYWPFSSIIICNIKSIRCTEVKKMAKNIVFGYLDHSKRHFSDFWMIHYDWYKWPNRAHHLFLS